jgi:long-chain fatty acid transport protein
MKRAAALGLAALLVASTGSANPADMFGFGPRGPALGNAMVASGDPLSGPVYNMAAGALGKNTEIGAGYFFARPVLDISGRDPNLMDARGTFSALSVPFSIATVDFGFGLALYMPDQFVIRLYSVPATEPRMVMWDNRPHRLVANGGLSARFGKLVSVGAGVTGLGDADGEVAFLLGTRPGRTVSDASIDTALPLRLAPVFGALVTPSKDWRFGARYTDEVAVHVDLDIKAETRVEGTGLSGTTKVRTVGLNYFTPREVSLGASKDLGPWTLSAELAWQQWSRIRQVAYVVEVDANLGIDTPVRTFKAPDPGWSDTFVPRAGVERRLRVGPKHWLALRAGYWFVQSPVPEQTGLTNFADASRHVTTAGAGLSFPDLGVPLTAELALQVHWLVRRQMQKGDDVQPGGDFDAGGRVYAGAAGLRMEL